MLYAIARQEGKSVGGVFRKDLKTIRGYVNWGANAAKSIAFPGQYVTIEIFRSEHPDHPYGNDALVGKARVLVTQS